MEGEERVGHEGGRDMEGEERVGDMGRRGGGEMKGKERERGNEAGGEGGGMEGEGTLEGEERGKGNEGGGEGGGMEGEGTCRGRRGGGEGGGHGGGEEGGGRGGEGGGHGKERVGNCGQESTVSQQSCVSACMNLCERGCVYMSQACCMLNSHVLLSSRRQHSPGRTSLERKHIFGASQPLGLWEGWT